MVQLTLNTGAAEKEEDYNLVKKVKFIDFFRI